jgi:hypothetical protein
MFYREYPPTPALRLTCPFPEMHSGCVETGQ